MSRPVSHYRFRLLDETGNDLGPLATQREAWDAGDRLSRWHGDDLEVVRVVEAEDHDPFYGYLVVKRR
jgi:hypothetical protein